MENAILPTGDVASRIANQTLAKRGADYASEVRRLLDAALEVIRRQGTSSRARVADIVTEAGLSNDAFYRHFPSKDALVVALLEDGTDRLVAYAGHQMAKETDPEGQVRRWVRAVMAQTKEEVGATTLAVLWNGSSSSPTRRHDGADPLARLLIGPLGELGCARPELAASLAAHAVVGKMSEYLWARTAPSRADVDGIVDFCLAAAGAGAGASAQPPASARPAATRRA